MRPLPLLVALVLLAPLAEAQPEPDYALDVDPLLARWVAEMEARITEEDRQSGWYPDAEEFLDRARAAAEDGRLRVTMYHLDTFYQLLLVGRFENEAAKLGNDAERRTLLVQQATDANKDAQAAWAAYRARLDSYEPQLRSLQAIEGALFSADLALSAALTATLFNATIQEVPRQQGFSQAYVVALMGLTHVVHQDLRYADEILTEATKREGLPPRVIEANWTNITRAALVQPRDSGTMPEHLKDIDVIGRSARANNESLLSIVAFLAERRGGRVNEMQTIFGDARTRGLNVTADAARSMSKVLNNTTLEAPRSVGLTGIFTSAAIDTARLVLEHQAEGEADLGNVMGAWAGLEHAGYVHTLLSHASPVKPAPTPPTQGAPGPALVALLGVAALLALARRRR